MLNIIKMDLYRLVRSKSFYVMIICAVMMAVACVAMSSVARVRMVDTTIEEGEELHEIKIMRKINSSKQVNLLTYYQAFVEKCYLLPLVSIFVALFVNGENKSGYIKSVAVQLPGRGKLAISKVIIAAIQTAVIMLAYTIIYFIGMKLVFGEKLVVDSALGLLKVFGLMYLLHFAFSAIIVMLTILFKRAWASILIGILCAVSIMEAIYIEITDILYLVVGLDIFDFNIEKYSIERNVSMVYDAMAGSDVSRVLIISVLYIVLATLVSTFTVQKRDV